MILENLRTEFPSQFEEVKIQILNDCVKASGVDRMEAKCKPGNGRR